MICACIHGEKHGCRLEADAPDDAGAGRWGAPGFAPRRSTPQQDVAVCATGVVKVDPELEINQMPRASSEETESDAGARAGADEGEPGGGDEEEEEEEEVASGPGDANPAEVRCPCFREFEHALARCLPGSYIQCSGHMLGHPCDGLFNVRSQFRALVLSRRCSAAL